MGGLKRYTIWLFNRCGESAGIERVIFTDDQLRAARRTYPQAIEEQPDRLIMLCDRSTVLARGDEGRQRSDSARRPARKARPRLAVEN